MLGVAVALIGAFAPGSSASVQARLGDARSQLTELTGQIKVQETQASALQDQLFAISVKVAAAQTTQDQLASELLAARAAADAAKATYADLQARFDALMRELYMQGSAGTQAAYLDAVTGSTSLTDMSDRLAFAGSQTQANVDLAAQASAAKLALNAKAAGVNALFSAQTEVVAQLQQAQMLRDQSLIEQQQALDALDATRSRIVALVTKLKGRLQAPDVAGIGAAFQGASHVSYGDWAGLMLQTLGVPACRDNLIVMVAWQLQEFTQAAWNPLATTHGMPGSTDLNSVGVQNFVSLEQGLEATKATIDGGLTAYGYGAIVSSLAACADPMATAQAVNASSWCRGCTSGMYLTGVIPKVEADYSVYAAL